MSDYVGLVNAEGLRWCSRCAAYMDVALFQRNRARRDGYAHNCRLCTRVLRRQTYERNREREIANARAWQAAHPDAARTSGRRANRVYSRLHADRRHAQYVQRRAQAQRRAAARADAAQRYEREEQAG